MRLKKDARPLSESSYSSLVTNDMIIVSEEGINIPTNTSALAAISPVLKDILRYNHDHYEEDTKLLFQDFSTETVESFLELVNNEDVCLTASQVEEIRILISTLGINQDFFSVSPVDDSREYLSRYSTHRESSTVETFQDQESSSQSKEVNRLEINDDKIKNIHPSFFQTS